LGRLGSWWPTGLVNSGFYETVGTPSEPRKPGARRRCPGNQLRLEDLLLVLVKRVGRLVDDELGRPPPQLKARLAYRGQRNGRGGSELESS
jgi:hypothetical protein